MSEPQVDQNAVISHEQDGRVLSGVGATTERLAEVMDRHAPDAPESSESAPLGTPASPTDEAPAPETSAPVESRGRKRFADLTRERDEAKAAREAAERERDELKARLEQPAQTPAAPQTPPPAPSQPAQFTFPDYETFVANGNATASYDDWRRAELYAFSEWKDQQTNLDARIRQALESDRETRSFAEMVENTRKKGRETYKDFDTVLASGPGALIPLGPTPAEAIQRAQFVIRHPQSEHLQYAILRDGALARRLQQMNAYDFGMTIAGLAPNGSGVSLASPAVTGSAPPPAPYQPVGGGGKTTASPSAELVKKAGYDFDKSGYREKRAAERGVTRRR